MGVSTTKVSVREETVNYSVSRARPQEDAVVVTPSDSIDLAPWAVQLFIGSAGNIKVTTLAGTTLVITGIPSGTLLPLSVQRVWSTSTTASNIIALFD